MKRSNLVSKSETAAILDRISAEWKGAFAPVPRIKNLRVHALEDGSQIVTGPGTRIARTRDGRYLPLLTETGLLERFPHVVVDMGAVRFVCKGANLMRPGITEFGEFEKGDIVCIRDESQGKYLAVGVATASSGDAEAAEKGEVLKNLHYVSDMVWEAAKEIREQ